jgi:hypothetical protein
MLSKDREQRRISKVCEQKLLVYKRIADSLWLVLTNYGSVQVGQAEVVLQVGRSLGLNKVAVWILDTALTGAVPRNNAVHLFINFDELVFLEVPNNHPVVGIAFDYLLHVYLHHVVCRLQVCYQRVLKIEIFHIMSFLANAKLQPFQLELVTLIFVC